MSTPAAFCEAGLAHFREGRHFDAGVSCRQALAIDAEHTDAQHLMGLLFLQAKQYNDALTWIVRAIQRAPKPEYLASFATVLQQHGRCDEALDVLDKAIQLQPNDAELWRQHGDICIQLARLDQALLGFQRALKLNPHHHDASYKSGVLLHKLGRNEEAIACLDLGDKLGRGLISSGPDSNGREGDGSEEVAGELVEAGRNASEVLELVEEAFNEVSLPVDFRIDGSLNPPVALGWDVSPDAVDLGQIDKSPSVITTIGDQVAGLGEACDQTDRGLFIGGLAWCQRQADGQAITIDDSIDLST